MNDFPDVLGMRLHDATALLEAEGLAYVIIETKPAKKELTEGEFRVIKSRPCKSEKNRWDHAASNDVSKQNRSIVLTVCRI